MVESALRLCLHVSSGCRLFRKPSRHGFSFMVGCRLRGEASFRQVDPSERLKIFFQVLGFF